MKCVSDSVYSDDTGFSSSRRHDLRLALRKTRVERRSSDETKDEDQYSPPPKYENCSAAIIQHDRISEV